MFNEISISGMLTQKKEYNHGVGNGALTVFEEIDRAILSTLCQVRTSRKEYKRNLEP